MLILVNQPRHLIGWLLSAIGLITAISVFATQISIYGFYTQPLPPPLPAIALWQMCIRDRAKAARALRPGGRLVVELLNPERIDKKDSTWWFADDKGLWGERPFLHLGERRWEAAERASVERFTTLDLASGALSEIVLCDQSYEVAEMTALLRGAGFAAVEVYPAWEGLGLYDACCLLYTSRCV